MPTVRDLTDTIMDTITISSNGSSSEFLFIDDLDGIAENANSLNRTEQDERPNHIIMYNKKYSLDETQHLNNSIGVHPKHLKEVASVSIPGDFDFIDDIIASPLSCNDVPLSLQNKVDSKPGCNKQQKTAKSGSLDTPSLSAPVIFKIPSIYLPSNLRYIDDETLPESRSRKLCRGDETHSSFRIPGKHSSKRRLCRYHSDSEARGNDTSVANSRHHRSRSRKVRRSISAIETNKNGYKPRVRRSVSDRSGMIMAGKHLLPPRYRPRPHSHCENGSSKCSSTRTLSTNVSISEIVAVEMGFKDVPGLTAKEARRKRIVCTVVVVTVTIVVICVLLLAVTLLLSPEVDALLRKENEEIYRSMAAGASTSSPTTEGAAVVANNSAPPSGNPG